MKVGATSEAMPKPVRPRAMAFIAKAELEGIGLGFCFEVVLAPVRVSMGVDLVVGCVIFEVCISRNSYDYLWLINLNAESCVCVCMVVWRRFI